MTKIDRLARSIIDLNNIVHELAAESISVLFLKDNMEFHAERTPTACRRCCLMCWGVLRSLRPI
nr:recombinase family protein [Marinococcus luteus]